MNQKPIKMSKKREKMALELENYQWFQYHSSLGWPIYLTLPKGEEMIELGQLLALMHFHKIEQDTLALEDKRLKILHLTLSTPQVARQIDAPVESDRYGAESVTPRGPVRIYRYRGVALLAYSFLSDTWELAHFENFAKAGQEKEAKQIINRFLSLALATMGVVGLWGVPVDDGVVVMKSKQSSGEAVFLDLVNKRILGQDGVKRIGPRFKILRLDPLLKGRNIRMSPEELFSFLLHHCSYLDYQGPSIPVRQMIQDLSRTFEGLIHPEESFRPRGEPSLRSA